MFFLLVLCRYIKANVLISNNQIFRSLGNIMQMPQIVKFLYSN